MARLLVVSRSMALGMRLADQHEVIEHSADRVDSLPAELDTDVLVLDLGDPVLAVNTVNGLREAERDTPVLLVSGYQPEWAQIEAQRVEGVHVVPLPITRVALLHGIDELTTEAAELAELARQARVHADQAPADQAQATEQARAVEQAQADQAHAGQAHAAEPARVAAVTNEQAETDPPGSDPDAVEPDAVEPEAVPAPVDPVRPPTWPAINEPFEVFARPAPAPSPGTPPPTPASQPFAAAVPAKPGSGAPETSQETETPQTGKLGTTTTRANDRVPTRANDPVSARTNDSVPSRANGPVPARANDQVPVRANDQVPVRATGPVSGPPPGFSRPIPARGPDRGTSPPDDVDSLFRPGAKRSPAEEIAVERLPIAPPPGGGTERNTPSGGVPRHGNPNATGAAKLISRFGGRKRQAGTAARPVPGFDGSHPEQGDPFAPPRGSLIPAPDVVNLPGLPVSPFADPIPTLSSRPTANGVTIEQSPVETVAAEEVPEDGGPAEEYLNEQFLAGESRAGDPDDAGFAASALDRLLDAEAAQLATARAWADLDDVPARTGDLIRVLLARSGELSGVAEIAQVLADDVIERADADATAVLVPDGPVWRVAGGVGLRPLERRLELPGSHWLITEIGAAGRAVLIEDTDIIRQQLAGAPLSAWRHLLAVPVPDVGAVVVLARGQEGGAFTDQELSAVIGPAREAATLLAQALQLRELARALSGLRDSD